MNAFQLSGQRPADICIFGIEGLFKRILGLPQGLCLALVGFDVGSEVIEFFLSALLTTSTDDSLFLSDMKL